MVALKAVWSDGLLVSVRISARIPILSHGNHQYSNCHRAGPDDVSAIDKGKIRAVGEGLPQFQSAYAFPCAKLGDRACSDVPFGNHISVRASRIYDRLNSYRAGPLYCERNI